MSDKKKDKTDKKNNKELEELKVKCGEYLNGWKRAQADYQNLKKEKEREKEEWVKYANAGLVMELLPVYDNLKLALEHVPEEQKSLAWVVGIEHIKNQLSSFLNDQGVEEIAVKEGDEFDLDAMEAVEETEKETEKQRNEEIEGDNDGNGELEDPEIRNSGNDGVQDEKENTKNNKQLVKKQVKAGYRMRGKVIVPVKVVVL